MKYEKQHYIPKFYLKNFSFQNNKKEIGIFNVHNKFFIQNGKLKSQCYKPFFYGRDGQLEKSLGDLENLASPTISEIVETGKLPVMGSEKHHTLLYFLILSEVRNPIARKGVIDSHLHVQQRLMEMEEAANSEILSELPFPSEEELIWITFSGITKSMAVTKDLAFKVILNTTPRPFITSDNPVVKYNQYLEQKGALFGKTGHASIGIQLFLPLSPFKYLLFYDRNTYKVGDKRKTFVEISKEEEVNQLNILQILNCQNTVYFDDHLNEQYFKTLTKVSEKFSKGNETKSMILDKINAEGEKTNSDSLIWLSSSSIDINLSLSGIALTKKIKSAVFDSSRISLRPKVMPIIKRFRY